MRAASGRTQLGPHGKTEALSSRLCVYCRDGTLDLGAARGLRMFQVPSVDSVPGTSGHAGPDRCTLTPAPAPWPVPHPRRRDCLIRVAGCPSSTHQPSSGDREPDSGVKSGYGVDPVSWTPHGLGGKGPSTMPKSRPPYPPDFRQRIIELVRKGRRPKSWPASSSPPPRRFAIGSARPIAMTADARMD